MGSSLTCRFEHDGGETRVSLSGEITEDSDFAQILAEARELVVVDLAAVKRINSCGVREWIAFVSALIASGKTLCLDRCSPPIVQQLNMISNFAGKSRVRSVFAPYYCSSCDSEERELLDLEGSTGPPVIAEFVKCPHCGRDMEFDDLPDTYLSFATS